MLSLVIVYLLVGIYYVIIDSPIPSLYAIILCFFLLKSLVNWRKCTLGYMECMYRGVHRDDGYINNLLDGIVDVRYTGYYPFIVIISIIILYYYYYCQ
jgi:hypothetical protein